MQKTTRREFILGACLFAGTLVIGGASAAWANDGTTLLRPPGGQDITRLRSLCIKCDRCRSVCPTNCIEPVSVEEGFADARTPKLNFHRGYCDFCDKCIDACPTGALSAFDPGVDRIGTAVINQEKCIAYTRGLCVVCEGSCPYDALIFNDSNRPVIEEEKCTGCGECVMACNVNVNRTYDGTFERAIEVIPEVI